MKSKPRHKQQIVLFKGPSRFVVLVLLFIVGFARLFFGIIITIVIPEFGDVHAGIVPDQMIVLQILVQIGISCMPPNGDVVLPFSEQLSRWMTAKTTDQRRLFIMTSLSSC